MSDDIVSILNGMLRDSEYVTLARSLFPDAESPADIAAVVRNACRDALKADISCCFHIELSIGAVFGLRLSDDRMIAMKLHLPSADLRHLRAVADVQNFLHQAAFPCPAVLRSPHYDGARGVTFEQWCTPGEQRHAVTAAARVVMAGLLARLVKEAARCVSHANLEHDVLPASLWPVPHNSLFDFGRTTVGAHWIDERARRCRRALDDIELAVVPGHTDWSLQHFRFHTDDTAAVVYDWDSLRLAEEVRVVGSAAATFTLSNDAPSKHTPTPEEAQGFVTAYEAARGSSFTRRQWRRVSAAALYAACYGARCEHAVGAPLSETGFRSRLHGLPGRGYFRV